MPVDPERIWYPDTTTDGSRDHLPSSWLEAAAHGPLRLLCRQGVTHPDPGQAHLLTQIDEPHRTQDLEEP
jgi:hypothetical protein